MGVSRVRKANDLWDIIGTFVYLKSIKRIDRAQSTTGYSDLQSLYRAARDGKGEGVIVELGSYKGKSSIALALGSQAGRRDKVYCVDPHRDGTRETFLKNVRAAGVEHLVVPVVAASADAAGGFTHPIRLIFIDGDHGYEGVKSDIELWKGKVVDGGILAFHDYTFPGVKKAVFEMLRDGGYVVETVCGCTLFVSKGRRDNVRLFEAVGLFNRMKERLFLRRSGQWA